MKLTASSLQHPAAVAVAVALVMLLGLISMLELPVQLFPDIERPKMSVQTSWRAASPLEIESEILDPQEEVLQGIPGLKEIEGNAEAGAARINLTFDVGTDMRDMLVEVLSRLNRVRTPLPPDATPPVVRVGADEATSALSWFFVQKLEGTPGEVESFRQFVEDRVIPRIEAIDGVAGVEINGSPTDELALTLDVDRAAALGVSIADIARRAARSTDVSGGSIESGRRQYTLRFAGRYQPQQLDSLIIAWRDGQPVLLRDIAKVEMKRPEKRYFAYQNGNPAIALRVDRESGANVLGTLIEVKRVVAELREGELKAKGLGIEQSFDPSLFIERAINLLTGNLIAGMLLAIGCLWWFLRDGRATLLIASAVPVSLFATFVVLYLTGRSLNVISIAGLAFAVGMVMDAAIVVAENILRLRATGMAPMEAALQGTRQVWGALFASTVTTIAVFLPVIFIKDVEGQLFADLALTITIAVAISLLIAATVVPAAAGRWLRPHALTGSAGGYPRVTAWVLQATRTRRQQWTWLGALVLAPILGAWALMPQLDYLPAVKRSVAAGSFSFPPGMSPMRVDAEMGQVMLARMKPYMDGEQEPHLKNWYLLLWAGGGSIGARAKDEKDLVRVEQLMRNEIVKGFPDTRAFISQGDLFGGLGGSSRAIAIHLQHPDSEILNAAAEHGRQLLQEKFAGANVQAFPTADAAEPELRVIPEDRRLAEVGWTREDLGLAVRVLGEGLWLGEHFDGDRRLPIILRARDWDRPEVLGQMPLVTPDGGTVRLAELARIDLTMAPTQLRRVDRRRTVTLTIDPPADLSLEKALAIVEDEIVPALRHTMPPDAGFRLSGSADGLDTAVRSIGGNFVVAMLVLFLLMASMFRSLRDSGYVMLTLPMAVFGGVLGLRGISLIEYQPLDLLSMIGFVMLMGMVINNAILLVAQAREGVRIGKPMEAALREALDSRLRPIMIGALTGVVGALPMALNPGPGNAIYRGLAAVTVGGVGLSLMCAIVLVPVLMRLLERGAPAVATAPQPTTMMS